LAVILAAALNSDSFSVGLRVVVVVIAAVVVVVVVVVVVM
jgi:hypothetical protein